jgi:hypothetical protein
MPTERTTIARETMILTLSRTHVGALNDALYTLLNDPEAEDEDLIGYQALRDEITRQIAHQPDHLALIAECDRYRTAIEDAVTELGSDHGDLWPHVGWHVGERLAEVLPLACEVIP